MMMPPLVRVARWSTLAMWGGLVRASGTPEPMHDRRRVVTEDRLGADGEDHRPHPQHRCLTEGLRRGVRLAVGVHTSAESYPIAAGQQGSHIASQQPGGQGLLVCDQAVLGARREVALEVHGPSIGPMLARHDRRQQSLWRGGRRAGLWTIGGRLELGPQCR